MYLIFAVASLISLAPPAQTPANKLNEIRLNASYSLWIPNDWKSVDSKKLEAVNAKIFQTTRPPSHGKPLAISSFSSMTGKGGELLVAIYSMEDLRHSEKTTQGDVMHFSSAHFRAHGEGLREGIEKGSSVTGNVKILSWGETVRKVINGIAVLITPYEVQTKDTSAFGGKFEVRDMTIINADKSVSLVVMRRLERADLEPLIESAISSIKENGLSGLIPVYQGPE